MNNIDLSKLIQDELDKQLSPEALQERVAEGVDKLVTKLMNEEVFGTWGIVQKSATEFIKENMKIDLSEINLLPMCDVIKNEFQGHLKRWDSDVRAKAVQDMAELILGKAPEQIKLSEIIDMIKGTLSGEADIQDIEIHEEERTYSNGLSIEWVDEYNDPQKLEFCIYDFVSDDKKQIHSIRFNGELIKDSIRETDVDGWLGTLLAIESHNVKYIHDMDDCELYYDGEIEWKTMRC